MVEGDIDLGGFSELATTDKKYVNGINLHEIRNETSEDYTGDFELTGSMIVGAIEHKTNIRFKKLDDFENYNNAIDVDYDSEDVTFTSYVYKVNTPQFNRVNRSQYGRGTSFRKAFVEYIGNKCYIPISGMCFINCIN